MTHFKKEFYIANPSPYVRSDYVNIDLRALNVPLDIIEGEFRLSRIHENGDIEEIPYQIDKILGDGYDNYILTLISTNTPPGPDDYEKPSARFILEEGKPKESFSPAIKENLWVGHYYKNPEKNEPKDGFNKLFFPDRKAYGLKLYNTSLEFYFSLVPHPQFLTENDYSGAITSLVFEEARKIAGEGEMLCPFGEYPPKRWGQLTELVFFPAPWELRWFNRISMLGKEYELIYSKSGPLRAIFTVKSEPLKIRYQGKPFFKPDYFEVECNLYRTIYVYPKKPYYTEEILALTNDGTSISFRPYYSSMVHYPQGISSHLYRFEHIPDYFAIWKHFAEHYRGYGFASDAHVRGIEFIGDEIRWRLPVSHRNRCVHYFMFHYYPQIFSDPFHIIGHNGWYENLFKPLQLTPLSPGSLSPFGPM